MAVDHPHHQSRASRHAGHNAKGPGGVQRRIGRRRPVPGGRLDGVALAVDLVGPDQPWPEVDGEGTLGDVALRYRGRPGTEDAATFVFLLLGRLRLQDLDGAAVGGLQFRWRVVVGIRRDVARVDGQEAARRLGDDADAYRDEGQREGRVGAAGGMYVERNRWMVIN